MKETQTSIRTLWTILSLIDDGSKNQTEISEWLDDVDQKLQSNNKVSLIKSSPPIISPIIKYLKQKKIIEIEYKDVKGTNIMANYCSIPNDLKTFINIMNEIESSQVEDARKRFFIRYLTKSKIGQKHIKADLIRKLLKNYKLPVFETTKEEENFIITTLQQSPKSLNYTINSIQKQQKEWHLKEAKDYYLYKIQNLLNLDILEQYPLHVSNLDKSQKIQFQTIISFIEDYKSPNQLNTDIKLDSIRLSFSTNLSHTESNLEQEIKNYVKTFN